MKNQIQILLIAVIAFITFCTSLSAQSINQTNNIWNYVLWVNQTNNNLPIKGYLNSIGENDITIVNQFRSREKYNIRLDNIEAMYYRKEGSVGRGFAIGTLSGAAIGALIGLAARPSEQPFMSEPAGRAILGGALVAVPGALIGAFYGSLRTKITLDWTEGNHKEKLKKYLYN